MGFVCRSLASAATALMAASVATPASALSIGFEGHANGEAGPFQYVFPGVTVDVTADIPPPGNHLGLAIFDSDTGGPNDGGLDPDLIVDHGNILILQNNDFPTQTTLGFFDTADDDEQGGQFFFDFSTPSFLSSIDLVDINGGGMLTLVLLDTGGETRTFSVPDDWTGDIDQGDIGFQILALDTLANQVGVGPPPSSPPEATASETAGFDQNSVIQMSITFSGSAAVDNLEFVPEPTTGLLLGLGLTVLVLQRRRS